MMGNKERIIELFQQLIDNALKFSRPDTKPFIQIKCNEELIDGNLFRVILISDNGIGFEQEYAQKAFSIFQRLNNKNNYTGLGVGLAITRKIVELHNGYISVQSTPNIGTSFTIKIPLKYNSV